MLKRLSVWWIGSICPWKLSRLIGEGNQKASRIWSVLSATCLSTVTSYFLVIISDLPSRIYKRQKFACVKNSWKHKNWENCALFAACPNITKVVNKPIFPFQKRQVLPVCRYLQEARQRHPIQRKWVSNLIQALFFLDTSWLGIHASTMSRYVRDIKMENKRFCEERRGDVIFKRFVFEEKDILVFFW